MNSNKVLTKNCFIDVPPPKEIWFDKLISKVGEELRKQGYSEATIIEYSKTAGLPYKNEIKCQKNLLYSSETSTQWLNAQQDRMLHEGITPTRFRVIKSSIAICEEYYLSGKIEKKVRHSGYKTQIASCFKSILDCFLNSLQTKFATRAISNHDSYGRNFFRYLEENVGVDLKTLDVKDIERYIINEYPTHKHSISDLIHSVDMLLSYLKEHGHIHFSIDCPYV